MSKKSSLKSKSKNTHKTLSGLPVDEFVDWETEGSNFSEENIGKPGEFPYTRGVYRSMYRGRTWTMRQFAGFGSPKDTNERFRYLSSQGISGLSTAFDMPTLMGYDPDHEMSLGEVGREGVSISTIEDMEELFSGINLEEVSTSMTINCSAPQVLAMYFGIALDRDNNLENLRGTIQNDILKEFIAQNEWISPPEPSLRLVGDVIEFCTKNTPKFYPVSISGYHIREAGSTAVQELAFTIYNGITYVEHCLERGLDVDDIAPQLSFFWDVHNDFFEEIAKFRVARRMWAKLMKERFGAKKERSLLLKTHAQTAGVSLTAQQPVNNVARVAIQALAAVLGGTQSLHTNSMDETLSLPTEEAVTVALRTQQIIADETGVTKTVDPLGGSWFLEDLCNRVEAEAQQYIDKLDKMGGMIVAIGEGYPQKEIAQASSDFIKEVESGEQVIVGVNKYTDSETTEIPIHKIDLAVEKEQVEKVKEFKKKRSEKEVESLLSQIKTQLTDAKPIMPCLIDSVRKGITVGEVADCYREVLGTYRDPGFL